MIREFNSDEQHSLLGALKLILILKYLQEKGFTFPDYEVRPDEEVSYYLEDFVEMILESIGCQVEVNFATKESGKDKGYNLYYDDEDGITIYEIMVNHKEINQYLAWGKKLGIPVHQLVLAKQSYYIVDSPSYMSGEETQESFLTDDYSSLCILENMCEFVNLGFIKRMLDFIEQCKIINKKRKFKHPRTIRRKHHARTSSTAT